MLQTIAGLVPSVSVSVSSQVPCLVNSEGLVPLVFSIFPGSYNFSASFSVEFLELGGEGFDRDLQFRLSA